MVKDQLRAREEGRASCGVEAAGTRYHGPPTITLVNLPATAMINLG
jgi:hypothetical protein